MKKLGIQTQWDSGEALRYNREALPTTVMGINVVKVDWWSQLALDNPGVKRIYRHHPNSDEIPHLTKWHHDPERAALDFVVFLQSHLGNVLDEIELIAGDNEFILGKDHEPPDRIDKADRFMAAFVGEADLLFGKGVCAGNFNVGHWGPETVDYFPHTLTAIQAQAIRGEKLSYFCRHEYNWPLLRDDGHWYTGLFLRMMPPILAQYPDVLCMITEVGIDKASRVWREGHAGFRKAHDDIGIAIDAYCGDHGLAWYNDLLNQTDYVAAALIFGCGMRSWRPLGFDIMNNVDDVAVLNRIKAYPGWTPPSPEPPNGDDNMVRVFDLDGKERDEEYAKTKYGVDWRRANVAQGQKVYRLIELWEKSGHHSLITQVLDENGQPLANTPVTFYWSGAPQPPDPPTPVYPHDWFSRFIWGLTNVNGDVGPGMGTGAYHGPGEGGPHAVWIHDPAIPSDICEKLGMMAGTFHDHFDQKFRLMTVGEDNGAPPPPSSGRFELVGKEIFENKPANRIIVEAVGERDFYDVRASVMVKGTTIDMGPFHPVSIRRFELGVPYNPGENELGRTFLVTLEHPDGTVLGGPWEFPYRTGILAEWQATVEWTVEKPEPPPTNGGLLVEVKQINEKMDTIIEKMDIIIGEEPPAPEPEVFRAEYFPNMTLEGKPALTRNEETIDHFWGDGSPGPPIPADYFSARWVGEFTFEEGVYEFSVLVDDGFFLWIDGALFIDAWKPQAPTQYSVDVSLSAGKHLIRAEYYEQTGGATCRLGWKKL
jgi:hypothetical protein